MSKRINGIINSENPGIEEIIFLLKSEGDDLLTLFRKSAEVKEKYVGNRVYLRGLIEFSNICHKNCFYCGIRKDNKQVDRYIISDDEILGAARYAIANKYGSIALQSGELEHPEYTGRVSSLLKKIKKMSGGQLRVTISLGEQEENVYNEWYNAGAHRYLLRIETSNRDLYNTLHPVDGNHSFDRRIKCLETLQRIGFQTGTGVMIGLPSQTIADLAEDLLFMRDFDIDMVGMGPYIEHANTPLNIFRDSLMSPTERFGLSLKMIAVLRILMKDINIVAATALQAIDPAGKEKAIRAGANIIMPNITPRKYSDSYKLYENKPITDNTGENGTGYRETRIALADAEVGYGEWGDSGHYFARRMIKNKGIR